MYSLNHSATYGARGPTATTTTKEWNGNQWVESRVALYTNYYHAWDAIAKQSSRTKEEIAWAKYNADLSSCAAHYFYQNPNVTQLPPEMKLPPAPPSSSTAADERTANHSPTSSGNTTVISPQARTFKKQGDGMKRYMDRCLERATTEAERKTITEKIRLMIQEELSQGRGLNTVDWDSRPLISLGPTMNGYSSPETKGAYGQATTFGSPSYYAPSYDDDALCKKKRSREIKSYPSGNASVGYYGPASNDSPQTSTFEKVPDIVSKKKRKASVASNKWTSDESSNGFDQSKRKLRDRASRFSGQGGLVDASSKPAKKTNWDKYKGAATIGGSMKKLDEQDYEKMTVKGTCETLEKAYLRLTAPPKAEYVRPGHVLQKHLANLKKERKVASRRDYLWFCSQFKAIRQDCTVQRIQNAFTVDVYETHARVALEEGDMNEFNQCQTQLIELYKHLTDPVALQNQDEFLGYRLIYQTFVMCVNGGGSADLFKTMLSVTHTQQHENPIIRHALAVRRASSIGDYYNFFRLYRECPNRWAKCLMDGLVAAVRFEGLKCIAKSYRPAPVSVDFVLQQLGFHEVKDGRKWLLSCGCKLSKDDKDVLTRDTEIHKSTMEGKKSLI